MGEPEYLHIVNWARFQHYKRRNAPWIKNYVAQLSDDDYLSLTCSQRGILHGLRLMYAAVNPDMEESRGVYEARARHLLSTNKAESRHWRSNLKALSDAGLVELSASKTLASCKRTSSPETETEQERKNPLLGEGPKRPAQVLWDSLVLEIYGEGFVATSTERGRLNKAIKELLEVGATPAQISERASEYRRRYQDAALTPQALTGNWSSLNGASGRPSGDEDDSQRSRELAARLRNGAQA